MAAARIAVRLIVDANVLVRCSVGRAGLDIANLIGRGVTMATTVPQVAEAIKVLVHVFGVPEERATEEVFDSVSAFEVYDGADYGSREQAARDRLHERGQPDWPVLATAMALDAGVWSDDRDFFGVGVAVWSTRNIRFAKAESV